MLYTNQMDDSSDESSDHSWFKCPELFVPQWVMGYAIETQRVSRWSWIQHEHLETWQYGEDSSFQILSIDVADVVMHEDQVYSFQIGISILDTERLGDVLAKPPKPNVNLAASVVESHHWVVGDEEYSPEFEDMFRFGRMKYVPMDDFEEEITNIVKNNGFYLIAHERDESLSFLRSCGVRFHAIRTIDTSQVVEEVFHVPTGKMISKREMTQKIGVACQDPCLAGNSAHFTLRILLMLIHEDVDRHLHRGGVPMDQWSLLLERIVNSPPKKRKLRPRRLSPHICFRAEL
ncbi:QDE-2-interacting protein [Fusarium tjaetaba]|uniref:QDE-2-interacting protein n=1 Tax=Fusarium tjaetaba TaxID=1567544 RepID=A0A8H5RZJ5_9HYPO|nr:QDE-2-interacting protein [Fusarium tjaetaba]KAF5642762.1 QDE-2-interacting protein [Fusarium tjaetaba]